MKYAVMPMTDYENICNAVREKSGKTDLLKSGEVSGEINAIDVGGDSDGLNNGTIAEIRTNVSTLRKYAFAELPQLKKASIPNVTELAVNLFLNDNNLTTIEMPNVTIINHYSFQNCTKLELTEFPSSLTEIRKQSFSACKGLKSITFKSTPTSIDGGAFNLCTNLLTINVPWAEGAVANAPWGATNATINYNYVGG
jgi:hypothetical protein